MNDFYTSFHHHPNHHFLAMLLFSVWASVLTLSITPIRSSGVRATLLLLKELAALHALLG